MNKYNIEVERTYPNPVCCVSLRIEAESMKQAHGFARTKAYKIDEFNCPDPEEIAIRGYPINDSQGSLF